MKLRHFLIFLSFLLILLLSSSYAIAQNEPVLLVNITDTIDQSTVEILTESMRDSISDIYNVAMFITFYPILIHISYSNIFYDLSLGIDCLQTEIRT